MRLWLHCLIRLETMSERYVRHRQTQYIRPICGANDNGLSITRACIGKLEVKKKLKRPLKICIKYSQHSTTGTFSQARHRSDMPTNNTNTLTPYDNVVFSAVCLTCPCVSVYVCLFPLLSGSFFFLISN